MVGYGTDETSGEPYWLIKNRSVWQAVLAFDQYLDDGGAGVTRTCGRVV